MKIIRKAAVLAAVAAAGLLGSGCGPQSCSLSPALGSAPASCTLHPATQVTVSVRWCDCGTTTRCDVSFQGDAFFLSPVADSCDASCPENPTSCPTQTSSCTFTTPDLGLNNDYSVTIADGTGVSTGHTFTIANAGGATCGP